MTEYIFNSDFIPEELGFRPHNGLRYKGIDDMETQQQDEPETIGEGWNIPGGKQGFMDRPSVNMHQLDDVDRRKPKKKNYDKLISTLASWLIGVTAFLITSLSILIWAHIGKIFGWW